jgi:dodecin
MKDESRELPTPILKEALRTMPDIYKVTELVGTSPVSFAEAVKAGIAEAAKTVRHMEWFEVGGQRGRIQNGKVEEFQVTLKVGFKLER